jgi:hypothetical protein
MLLTIMYDVHDYGHGIMSGVTCLDICGIIAAHRGRHSLQRDDVDSKVVFSIAGDTVFIALRRKSSKHIVTHQLPGVQKAR